MNTPGLFFINVLLIACMASIATDIYAPSLTAIASQMHAPIAQAQFSLTIFMVGLTLSQLIYGPISEGVGRRIPLIAGILIFIGGSLLCVLATRIEFLILGRLIQGLGAGACSSLWRSVFRDVWKGDDLAKYGAWLSVVITFFIPAVPILGGYFQSYLGWQASFGFLLVYSLVTLLLIVFIFKETSQYHHPERLKPVFIRQAFKQLLTSPIFMGYTLAVFFCYGAFFSWFAVGPVLLIKHLGLSPVEFGWISFVIGAGAMGSAGAINGKVVKRFGGQTMLRFGFATMLTAGCLLLLGYLIFGTNIYAIILPVFLFYFGVTFIWPNAFAGAFTPFGSIAGYAGSLYSFMQLGGGAFIGSISAWLPANSQLPIAVIFIVSPILAYLSYEGLVKPSKVI
ncbi:MAG: multidrug effflux MFS transporter [Tatlockia sp.]|nr:multidrug effflux MFS transporter [Tatlockia sp.]